MTQQSTEGFFGGTIPAVKFETPGDNVKGTVLDKEMRQQTNADTGKLVTWPDGRPKMQAIVTLQVSDPTDDDDGRRNLYVRGYMQRAVVEAVKAAKLRDLPIGSTLAVVYVSDDKPTRPGLNGAKQYTAEITV